MPGKNGKKGFLKLTNEEVAVMGHQGEDSGSEIELLDITEIDHYDKDVERKSSRGRGCCCDCCIAFYLFLLTIVVVLISLFVLNNLYYVQTLKKQVPDMDNTIQELKKELKDLQHKHDDQASKHSSRLHALNTSLTTLKSSVTGLTSSVTSLTSKIQHIGSKMSELESLAAQLDTAQMVTFNQSMTKVMSFSKEVNEIHISMAYLNSAVESLNNQVTETKKYCSDFGTKIETISTKTSETDDAVKVIKSDNKARNKHVDLELLKLTYFKGNTTQKLHQMEWVLKTSPEELINTIMNRTSPSEDHLNEIIDLKLKLTKLSETMDFVLEKLTNLTEVTPTEPMTPPTNTTDKITPITDQTTPSSSKTPDSSPKHSSTSATEDHPKTDAGTLTTPTRPPNTTTSANKPHSTVSANKTMNIQTNITALDNDNNETTLPTENKTTPTANSTYMATPPGNTTEAPTSSSERAEQALKNILESFDEHDLDGDGRLSLEEFRQIYDNFKIFEILDKNRDGGITKTELTQLLKNVQDNEHEETTIRPPNRPDNIDVDDDNSQDNELTSDDDNGQTPIKP